MSKFHIPQDAEEQFDERGYFVVRNIIDADAVLAVRNEVKRIIDVEEGFQLDKKRTDGIDVKGADAVRAVRDRNFLSEVLWRQWFTAEHVIELQQRFVGDNVRVQGTSFFTKPARIGEGAPWHQDIWLWARDPSSRTREYKTRHLSCWVALELVDLENGCLHVVPGSHKGEIIEHVKYADAVHEEIPRELVAQETPEPVPLNAGDAVVWQANMWHMSPPNLSDRTRWGGVMVTLPAEVA
ncbi:MAG: phytanoyl-CoA dioxygenase family protein, partial [Candidatus Latescibacteria bacterium]|nr:phytanoyl-CoA dioxygenase family protein [Candidatus Latescibacterota bacterium]